MKNRAVLLMIVLGLAVTWGAVAATTDESTTLKGEYVWDQGGSVGDLKAVFEPAGKDKWDVSFYFTFRDESHTYTGTAKGSLGNGELAGTVFNESKNRTFTFEGAFNEGVFEGNHRELQHGKVKNTGTLTLAG